MNIRSILVCVGILISSNVWAAAGNLVENAEITKIEVGIVYPVGDFFKVYFKTNVGTGSCRSGGVLFKKTSYGTTYLEAYMNQFSALQLAASTRKTVTILGSEVTDCTSAVTTTMTI